MGVVGILGSLVSLAVPGLIIWGIVSMVRRGSSRAGREGATGSVRYFFQFAVTLGLLLVADYGLIDLVSTLTERARGTMIVGQGALALPLALLIVGTPLLTIMVMWLRRAARADARLGESGVAMKFTAFALLFSLGNLVSTLASFLGWAFGFRDIQSGGAIAALVVWGGTWVLLWRAESGFVAARRRALHIVLGSLMTAVITVVGAVMVIGGLLRLATGLVDNVLYGAKYVTLLTGLTLVLAAAPFWAWYWLRNAPRLRQTPLWQAFVLIAGVGGGLIMAVVAASISVYQTLVWFLGEHESTTARTYFDGLPMLLAVVVVGLGVWGYHERQLPAGAARTEVNRIYDYLLSGIGLVAGAVGVSTVVVAVIEAATRSSILTGAGPVNTLLVAGTLIAVGGPVWVLTWSRVQHLPVDHEHGSPSRRIYLYLLFGVGGITAVVCLIVVAYMILNAVLTNSMSMTTVRDSRFAVGILASTVLVAGFHWRVYRGERDVEVHVVRPVRSVTLLGPEDEHVAQAVAERTGARVRLWVRTDDASLAWDTDAVVGLVERATGDDVVVVADASGAFAIPFRH